MRSVAPTQLLRNVWLFERCSRHELAVIARSATTVDVAAGKVLAREGDTGREFFIIRAGTVEVLRAGTRIGTLGPGNFFGEMALLDRQPRAATIIATEPSTLLVLSAREFSLIVDSMPSVDRKIMAVLASRVRELEDRFLPEERLVRTEDRMRPTDEARDAAMART